MGRILFRGTTRFEIIAEIGRGGSGVVYRAHDRDLGTDVALKTLSSLAPQAIAELKREFRALLGISHRNLVQLHELFVDAGAAFFTMELVQGRDIVSTLRGATALGEPLPPDEHARFRAIAAQLIAAIDFVHGHRQLHRDIKPSNILVSEEDDRVVLLDFGLALARQPTTRFAQPEGDIAGTLAYMAPELLAGEAPSPASDWYALGGVLAQVWTGRPPQATGADAGGIDAGSFSGLVRRMLDEDPGRRPYPAELRAALSARGAQLPREGPAPGFIGRRNELDALRTAAGDCQSGTPVLLCVRGPSGIGKSSLIQHFALTEEGAGSLVFHGRCHHQESVPYKGIDGLLDQVAEFLDRLAPAERAAHLPAHLADVARVFPVFSRRAWESTSVEPGTDEPTEIRRRAFTGVRDLLRRIGERHRTILWIDDLQWADADSGVLLREILRPPHPRCLVLLSYRVDDAVRAESLIAMSNHALEIRHLDVGPLNSADAFILTQRLTNDADTTTDQLHRIVAEAAGIPLFLDQLARHNRERSQTDARRTATTFEEVVSDRLSAISDPARALVDAVSVAGQALDRNLAFTAAGLTASARPLSIALEADALLRSTAVGSTAGIEIYHDKIREVVVARMSGERRRQVHLDLARTAESSPTPDPVFLYRHYKGADQPAVAGEWALRGAEQAEASLAFLEAARLFAESEALLPDERARPLGLDERRAVALVNAGHCASAAPVFATAARRRPTAEAQRLRRLAAEQFLVSGHIDDGVRELRALCAELGVPFPRSGVVALLRMFAKIAQLRLRRLEFGDRDATTIAPHVLTAIDLCDSAGKGLVVVDPMRGLYFSFLSLFLALRAGEATRVARGLCMGGAALSPIPAMAGWGRSMIDRVRDLGAQRGDPYFAGLAELALGQCLVIERDWPGVLRACDHGAQILERGARGTTWERNVGRMAALRALEELARIPECIDRTHLLLAEAEDRGDRYAQVVARQNLAAWRLAADDPEGAAREMDNAIALWGINGFHVQHFYAFRLETMRLLYLGEFRAAWDLVNRRWGELRRANLLQHPTIRADAMLLRGRVAIAAGIEERGARRELVRARRSALRVLARDTRSDLAAHLTLLRAGANPSMPLPKIADPGTEPVLLSERILEVRQLQRAAQTDTVAQRLAQFRTLGIARPARWIQAVSPGLPPLPEPP